MSCTSNHPDVGNGSQTITGFEVTSVTKSWISATWAKGGVHELAPVDGATGVTWGFKSG